MKARILLAGLAATIAIAATGRTAQGQEAKFDFKVDGIGYTVYTTEGYSSDDVYVSDISDLCAEQKENGNGAFEIPASVTRSDDGKQFNVTGIGKNMFAGLSGVKSVTLPDGILELQPGSFADCENLEYVYLGKSLKTMWGGNFSGTPALKEIEFPNTLEAVHMSSFCKSGLRTVKFPEGIQKIEIGRGCFKFLDELESVVFPKEIQIKMQEDCFSVCSKLKSIVFPEKLSRLSPACFTSLGALEDLYLPYEVENADKDGWLHGSDFTHCPALKRIYNPNAVPPSVYVLEYDGWQSYAAVFIADPAGDAGVDKSECVLYVPVGSAAAYAESPAWRDFVNIEEYTPAAADDVLYQAPFSIHVDGNMLRVDSEVSSPLVVAAPDGRLVIDQCTADAEFMLAPGLYIISYCGEVSKICIR